MFPDRYEPAFRTTQVFCLRPKKRIRPETQAWSPTVVVISIGWKAENMVTRWVVAALHWENTKSGMLTTAGLGWLISYMVSTKQMTKHFSDL